jgi:thioredoxin reductase (NADPH)
VNQSADKRSIRLLGPRGSPAAYALRDFLTRSDVPFEWVELLNDEQAHIVANVDGLRDSRLPLCILPDGSRLHCPTLRHLSEKLGMFRAASSTEYDLVILGAGPAGLSAAVYGASEGLKTVVIERCTVGGQAGSSSRIENYMGFPDGISGAELAKRAKDQACKFGAEILLLREGVGADFSLDHGVGYLSDGTKFVMHASICASGVEYRKLNLPNENDFRNRGLFYGAGASEAALLCKKERTYIVGGGNSAGQAAMHFVSRGAIVTMVVRGHALKDTLSQYLVDRIEHTPEIEVLTCTEVTALHGADALRAITLTNRDTGKETTVDTHRIFLCLGGCPNTDWAEKSGIVRDEDGYLVTGPDLTSYGNHHEWPLSRPPYYLETSTPGLFAAGDVRHGSVKRCASAVGEGAMAVTFVHRYLTHRH